MYNVIINKGNQFQLLPNLILFTLFINLSGSTQVYSNNNEAIHVRMSNSVRKLCPTSPSTVAVLRCVVNWIVRELFDGSASQSLTVQWRQWKQFW